MIKGNKISIEKGTGMSLATAEFVSFWSNWVLIAALIVGVAATYGIVVSGNVKEFALKREMAASNERAAAAELETQQIKQRIAPRFMKREPFLNALKGQPKGKVEMLYLRDDPECFEVAQNIALLLQEAGWDVISRRPIPQINTPEALEGPSSMAVSGQPSGITVVARSASPEELDSFPNKMMGKPWVRTPYTVLKEAISQGFGRVGGWVGGPNAPPEGTLRITVAPKGTAG